jgi:ferritin
MKQTTLDALSRVYVKLEEITRELYNLADDAVDQGDFDDASLLQARANILYEQMENIDIVISELGG